LLLALRYFILFHIILLYIRKHFRTRSYKHVLYSYPHTHTLKRTHTYIQSRNVKDEFKYVRIFKKETNDSTNMTHMNKLQKWTTQNRQQKKILSRSFQMPLNPPNSSYCLIIKHCSFEEKGSFHSILRFEARNPNRNEYFRHSSPRVVFQIKTICLCCVYVLSQIAFMKLNRSFFKFKWKTA